MSFLTRARLANPAAAVVLSCVTVTMLCSSPAQGGCSAHYVTSRAQLVGDSAQLEQLERLLADGSQPSDTLPAQPVPCSGALCSGNPAPPVSAVPSTVRSAGGEWAISTRFVAGSCSDSFHAQPPTGNLRPLRTPAVIFHPPRP
jgi:hypothetical protein